MALVGLGLGLSAHMHLAAGLVLVIAYLALSINSYLETHAVEAAEDAAAVVAGGSLWLLGQPSPVTPAAYDQPVPVPPAPSDHL